MSTTRDPSLRSQTILTIPLKPLSNGIQSYFRRKIASSPAEA